MQVHDLMTTAPVTAAPDDNLAFAAKEMWDNDCGILPIVKDGRLVGLLTDRDIAMALGMRGMPARQVKIGGVAQKHIFQCAPTDDVREALQLMTEHQVRRVPVVEDGALVGLLSLNDIALEAKEAAEKDGPPTYEDVGRALQGICAHRLLAATA
jgi:CBS domain-containing protein